MFCWFLLLKVLTFSMAASAASLRGGNFRLDSFDTILRSLNRESNGLVLRAIFAIP